jgi:hypothetical protein
VPKKLIVSMSAAVRQRRVRYKQEQDRERSQRIEVAARAYYEQATFETRRELGEALAVPKIAFKTD